MYPLMPIMYLSAEEYVRFRHAYLKAMLPFWGIVVAVALAAIVLTGASAGWLHMIEWCSKELTPIGCSLYMAGI